MIPFAPGLMADLPALDVRELAAHEVAAIALKESDGKGFVDAMWRLQRAGSSLLLVAWMGSEPVGSGQLDWRTTPPELKNLNVDADHRGLGIGSAIVRAAEERIAAGASLVLVVGLDNPRARALYERLGYKATGQLATTTYEYVDGVGVRRQATETDEVFMKQISSHDAR